MPATAQPAPVATSPDAPLQSRGEENLGPTAAPKTPGATPASEASAAGNPASRRSSTGFRLKKFKQRVLHKVATPLLPPIVQITPVAKLPLRSRRLAEQPLSRVPVSKRGEFLVMKRLGYLGSADRETNEAKQAYDRIFTNKLSASHAEALRVLFPDPERPARRRGRSARRPARPKVVPLNG